METTYRPTRTRYGYTYRGFYIERAAARQWNIYPDTETDRVVPDYDVILNEGLRSLADAIADIDADLAR